MGLFIFLLCRIFVDFGGKIEACGFCGKAILNLGGGKVAVCKSCNSSQDTDAAATRKTHQRPTFPLEVQHRKKDNTLTAYVVASTANCDATLSTLSHTAARRHHQPVHACPSNTLKHTNKTKQNKNNNKQNKTKQTKQTKQDKTKQQSTNTKQQ